MPWSHCFLWRCTCEWILPRRPVKILSPRSQPRISRRSKSLSTNPSKGPGWYSYFLRLERPACGGPPQSNNSCSAIRTPRSGCWWFGSRYFQRTCALRFIARSGESQTGVPVSSGTRNISSRKNFAGLLLKAPGSRALIAASTADFSGMTPFSMHHARSGDRLLRRSCGMVRSCA